MPKAELDPCADAAARSLACQTANPGAKKLTVCNDVIQVYKKCRDEQLAKAREERGRRALQRQQGHVCLEVRQRSLRECYTRTPLNTRPPHKCSQAWAMVVSCPRMPMAFCAAECRPVFDLQLCSATLLPSCLPRSRLRVAMQPAEARAARARFALQLSRVPMASPNARPLATPADFAANHVISIQQFTTPAAVSFLCDASELMARIVARSGGCELLKHRVLANVFYEPSTRTSCSFASAMQRLGGSVLQVNESTSSAAKGETLGDSVRALACYADAVVLRHPAKGSAAEGSAACPVPLLNAGDGVGEHPTQALLDFFCIRRELGRVAGLTVTLVGDLANGRTVHSLARLLALGGVGKINYVAPPELQMPDYIQAAVAAAGIPTEHFAALDAAMPHTDVLYVTRVQKERFADLAAYEALKLRYVVTRATMALAKERMVVMHPLPRVGEIAEEVDSDPRAAYFRQMRCGLYVRMALLALCMGVSHASIEAEAGKA